MTEYQTIEGTETVIRDGTIKLHGEAGFEGMRKAGRLAAVLSDLPMAAKVLTDLGEPELAATLLGVRSAGANRAATSSLIGDMTAAMLTEQLGADFDSIVEQGRHLSTEDAAGQALAALHAASGS